MIKDTYYFSHDYNARTDPALQRLQMEMGHEGKGIYWDLVEMLYENEGYIPEEYLDTIAFDLRIELEKLKRVVYRKDLFKVKGGLIYSDSVLRRLGKRKIRADQAKRAAEARWGIKEDDNIYEDDNKEPAMPNDKDGNAENDSEQCYTEKTAMQENKTSNAENDSEQCSNNKGAMQENSFSNALKESKGKESKVKESKKKESKGKEIKEKKGEEGGKSPPVGYFKELKACFLDVYVNIKGVDYYFTAKDAGQLKQLEKKIWKSLDNAKAVINDENMTGVLTIMMRKHGNKWISENLSIPILNSKYNEIIAGIKEKSEGANHGLKKEIYDRLQSDSFG